ncbi:MAG: methylated-DNA--[protein]-cysteine S-methyltransferase [Wenzhouxiangellaceae bacterium]|nr:methylated-DNA--[protein]-cysteine S-methyltransferase [Wenzhouxiangellaceae bacterium]MBS3823566.1 methylated-DNA--[protein]-cysteine S-methyltransferase [Wenzhouxiangellaceae bacterium]
MSALGYSHLKTPLGWVQIKASDAAINGVRFVDTPEDHRPENTLSRAGKAQLAAWFQRERTDFDLPLAPQGTAFQQAAWNALQGIPYGETRCYAQQADLIGRPGAIRAIGAANGANPIAVVVPCHRVIGKDGSLTGYAGGLKRKEWLLAFEKGVESQADFFAEQC